MRAPTSALALSLAACAAAPAAPDLALAPALLGSEIGADAEGRCWGRHVEPAVVETVTVQEEVAPPFPAAPATFRSTTRQEIRRERREVSFETLCPPAWTPDFVASLQRALAARGFYDGPATGAVDAALGRAVQDFQREGGPDSPLLSLDAARSLGLVPLSPEQLDTL